MPGFARSMWTGKIRPRCDREGQRRVPIDVGDPTQGRLFVLELEALVGREVEEDVVLAASGADLGGGAVRVLKAHVHWMYVGRFGG